MVTHAESVDEARSRSLTLSDLQRMPDDGRRHELVDGVLTVRPVPPNLHQLVVRNIASCLHRAAGATRAHVVLLGSRLVPDERNVLVPDLSLVPVRDYRDTYQRVPPDLVVEVTTAAPEDRDRARLERCARFGVPRSWSVTADPELGIASLTAFELRAGAYERVAHAAGDDTFATTRPLPVRVSPSQLVELYPEW